MDSPAPAPSRAEFESRMIRAFNRAEYAEAEAVLREWLVVEGDNFVPHYNLACALAQQGKVEAAAESLKESVALGFQNLLMLKSDPHLEPLRRGPNQTYAAIVEGWDRILDARAEANLDLLKKRFGPKYAYELDERARLAFASGFDPALFGQAKRDIAELTDWWERYVSPPVRRNPARVPWVSVILPTRTDYAKWAIQRFGEGWQRIGGSYSHDSRTLVAQDLGSSMRHEFWHALHWRHMEELGQSHPVWVMEGLCSLVEDVREEPGPGGGTRPVFLPSWRTNMARRLAIAGKLMPWDVLFEMGQKKFVGDKPLAYYAQSRAVFLFLHERGKLREWYAAYTRGFGEDPSGRAAFAEVFGRPAAEVEAEYEAWLRALPEVADELKPGMATLPFDLEPGSGDGIVLGSPARTRSGRASGLKLRDVITSIDDEPVRDMYELVRVLAAREPGTTVRVGYRRGKSHGEASVALVRVPE